MNIDKVTNEISAIVRVNLKDGATYPLPQGTPMHVGIEYRYEQTPDVDGWTNHAWRGYNIAIGGIDPETGDHFHKTWTTTHGEELANSRDDRNPDMPLWIRKLIDDLRPAGDLSLATIK